jgi:hypothetical protein
VGGLAGEAEGLEDEIGRLVDEIGRLANEVGAGGLGVDAGASESRQLLSPEAPTTLTSDEPPKRSSTFSVEL